MPSLPQKKFYSAVTHQSKILLAEPSRLKTRLNPARHRIDHLDDFSSKKSKTRIAPRVSCRDANPIIIFVYIR